MCKIVYVSLKPGDLLVETGKNFMFSACNSYFLITDMDAMKIKYICLKHDGTSYGNENSISFFEGMRMANAEEREFVADELISYYRRIIYKIKKAIESGMSDGVY